MIRNSKYVIANNKKMCDNIIVENYKLGYSQAVRHLTLTQAFPRFES